MNATTTNLIKKINEEIETLKSEVERIASNGDVVSEWTLNDVANDLERLYYHLQNC